MFPQHGFVILLWGILMSSSDPTHSIVGTRVNFFQTELMVEVCSKSLVKTHKGVEKWPLFVNKQLFWWSASITLDNNNAVLTDL